MMVHTIAGVASIVLVYCFVYSMVIIGHICFINNRN